MTTTLLEPVAPSLPVLDEETRVVLARAKGIIANGWCQGRTSDADGNHCVVGAVVMAAAYKDLAEAAWHALDVAAGVINLAVWNDVPGRTQAEVVALFDRALGA